MCEEIPKMNIWERSEGPQKDRSEDSKIFRGGETNTGEKHEKDEEFR